MNTAISIFKYISKKLDHIAAIVLFLNCLLVVANVVTRSPLLEMPIFGVYEIVCYLSLICISFSISKCALEGGHTNLTFLLEKVSIRTAKIITLICNFVVLINFIFISWNFILYTIERAAVGDVSAVVRIPIVFVMIFICIGFILLTLTPLVKIIEDINDLKIGETEK